MDKQGSGEFRRGGVEYLGWIEQKIHESDPNPADKYRFVFRELVQNADDADAEKVVIRFRDEELLIANDGHAFREGEEDDFDRILGVLEHHKKGDPDKLGEFGSGFQTVFRVTNRPVVISNGKRLSIDPVMPVEKRGHLQETTEEQGSPYAPQGALIKLPWRTSETVEEAQRRAERHGTASEAEDPFADETWTRWGTDERRAMYEELVDYAHSLILCTTSVEEIRVLWEDGEEEGHRVTKDFTCTRSQEPTSEAIVGRGEVREEPGVGGWNHWDERGGSERYQYLVCHRNCASDEGELLWVVEDDGSVRIETSAERPEGLVKKNEVWILLPLFPADELDGRYRFTYTMIPLTSRSGNHFVTSAHLFPTQDRKDIDRGSRGGTAGEWADIVKANALELYKEVFPRYVDSVRQLGIEPDRKQRVLLDALPAAELDQWIHPVGRDEESTTIDLDIRDLMAEIADEPIIRTLGSWKAPAEAPWSSASEIPEILRRVGVPHIPSDVIEHRHFLRLERAEAVREEEITPDRFEALWTDGEESVVERFGTATGSLEYGAPLERGAFDKRFAELLIEFAVLGEDAHPQYHTMPIIPTREGEIRPFRALKGPPEDYEALTRVLPDDVRPHDDIEDLIPVEALDAAGIRSLLRGLSASDDEETEDLDLIRTLYSYAEEVRGDEDRSLPRPEQLRSAGWSFVLTRDDDLRPPAETSYAPETYYESSLSLFDEHDIDAEWVHPELVAKHEELLAALGVSRPPYRTLADELAGDASDLEAKERRLLVEGVTSALAPREATDVRFLASGEHLLPPSKALIGKTGDEYLDRWVGVIDDDLESFVEEQNLGSHLLNAGVRKTKPLHVLRRIEEQSEEDPDRFDGMDEADHKGVTAALAYCRKEGWRPSMGMGRMNVVPYRQRGELKLGPVIPEMVAQGGSHRAEHYSRGWIFLEAGGMEYLTEEIRHEVKILSLHEGIGVEPNQLKRTLGLVRLSRRNLVRHFIADHGEQESLFRESGYTEFVPDSTTEGFQEIRDRLLDAVPEYFDRPSKQEFPPDMMKEIPLLYDQEGEWAAPKEFALKADVEMELFGMRDLHPDFESWPDETLQAVGVSSDPEPSVVLDRIKEFARHDDLHGLENALRLLLTSDSEYPDDYGIRHKLKDLAWVPTEGDEVVEPSEAIIPTKRNQDALGSDYHLLASVHDEIDWSRSTTKNRAERLGLRVEPPLEALEEVLAQRSSNQDRPPKDLFRTLSRRLNDGASLRKQHEYHDGTGWYAPEDVYLRELPFLPDRLKRDLVVEPREEHIPFLREVGAKQEPSIDDLVDWLQTLPLEQTDALFGKLVERRDEIPTDGPRRYGDVRINVPSLGTKLTPERTIFIRGSLRGHHPIRIGSWTFLDEEALAAAHEDCLRALGARTYDDLQADELLELQGGLRPTPEHLEINLLVLEQLVARDAGGESVEVPIQTKDRTRLVPVSEAIFPDDPASRLLEEDAEFISTSQVPSPDDFLPWAESRGLDRLSEIIEKDPKGWDWGEGELDEDQGDRLSALSLAMVEILRRKGHEVRDRVRWMEKARVRKRGSLLVEIDGEGFGGTRNFGCIHREHEDGIDLYIPVRGPPSFLRDIAHTLVSLTEQKEGIRLGPEEEQDVVQTVQTLLGTKPSRWNRVTDLDVEGPPVDPLMEVRDELGDERYYEIRDKLSTWYDACQICNLATPRGPDTTETMEKIRSVVTERGGPYTGERSSSVSNALWLCPRHSALFERGLVKIHPLEDGDFEKVQELRDTLEKRLGSTHDEDDLEEFPNLIEVRTHRYNERTGSREEHVEDDIVFHMGHLRDMLAEWEEFLATGGKVH